MVPQLRELLESAAVPKLPGEAGTVEPACPHFGVCGGCQLQHLAYPEQLDFKRAHVVRMFEGRGLDPKLVHPVLGAPEPWAYRNKIDLTAKTFGGDVHLGFLPYGEKHTLIEMERCPVADASINESLAGIRKALTRHPELRKRLISIVCRASRSQQKVGLVFHGKLKEPEVYQQLATDIAAEAERVVGGLFVNKRKEHVTGENEIQETICGKDFRYPLRSFFQANPPQTEAMVELVARLLDPKPQDVLLDVYAGVGLFGLILAERLQHVYLLEDTPYSADGARENAARFGIKNVTILRGQAEERVELMLRAGQYPSCIILDPPRSGCHENAIKCLTGFPSKPRIVYVSCNPETHARDCAMMVERGYRLEGVWPVDLFPQTLHVEGVALLSRP